jgi:hypothetical protein
MNDEQMKLLPKHWTIPLELIADQQILYNGKFSYLRHYRPASGGWCHLLLLRSQHSSQKVAIVTQVPDCVVSIVNTIEDLAGFVINFFHRDMVTGIVDSLRGKADEDSVTTPDNTTIVEYLPTHCFGKDDSHDSDTIAIMQFDWQVVHPQTAPGSPYYEAKNPQWGSSQANIPPREALITLLRNL